MTYRNANTITMLLCSIAVLAVGCRRPAYQDLYVQNMSAEIRELEDIIYEYDHEYRKLELELEQLDRENQFLKQQQMSLRGKAERGSTEGSASSKLQNAAPKSELKPNASDVKGNGGGKAWQGRDAGQGGANAKSKETELPPITIPEEGVVKPESKTPAGSSPEKSLLPKSGVNEEQSTPLNKLEPSTTLEPPALKLPSPGEAPTTAPKEIPSLLPPPITPSSTPEKTLLEKAVPEKTISKPRESSLLEPPVIDLGEPASGLPATGLQGASGEIPGKIEMPKKPAAEKSLELLPPPGNGAMEIELGRLPRVSTTTGNQSGAVVSNSRGNSVEAISGWGIGVTPASATTPVERQAAILQTEMIKPLDQRMTEITFVKPFSVSLDLDGEPGDDGIRLVLQPRNSAGDFLEQSATLSVSAIDPDKRDDSARLGIWRFTPQQVEESMRRSGVAKGIHLDLSLAAKMPSAKRVVIFIRYETNDGRRLEASHEYYLSTPGELESKWLPRADNRADSSGMEKSFQR